jgi:hypothetical protein
MRTRKVYLTMKWMMTVQKSPNVVHDVASRSRGFRAVISLRYIPLSFVLA